MDGIIILILIIGVIVWILGIAWAGGIAHAKGYQRWVGLIAGLHRGLYIRVDSGKSRQRGTMPEAKRKPRRSTSCARERQPEAREGAAR